jgi:LacI family transcriptional regulator
MAQKKNGLKDIAAHLDVSVTTVARALSQSSLTSAKTLAKVEAAAAELGYVRNLDGVRLRTGKTFVIAAQLKFPQKNNVGDGTLPGLLQGIHARCSTSDYAVTAMVSTSLDQDIAALERILSARMADAVVLDYTAPQDQRVKLLLDADMPFVTYGRTELPASHAFVDIDNEDASWQGTKAMIQAGHTRIALLDGERHLTYVKQRVQGYKRALAEAGLPFDPDLVSNFEPDAEAARDRARHLVASNKVDAMVCINDSQLWACSTLNNVVDASMKRLETAKHLRIRCISYRADCKRSDVAAPDAYTVWSGVRSTQVGQVGRTCQGLLTEFGLKQPVHPFGKINRQDAGGTNG